MYVVDINRAVCEMFMVPAWYHCYYTNNIQRDKDVN